MNESRKLERNHSATNADSQLLGFLSALKSFPGRTASYITTLKFIIHTLTDIRDVTVESTRLKNDKIDFAIDIYQPKKTPKATILLLHGMNKLGNKDERLMGVAKALAHSGYRVVFPEYPIIAKHRVALESVTDFAETIKAITSDASLCPAGKLGIFTASFSGSFSIRAVLRPEVAPLVTCICTIGVCYFVRSVFTNMFDDPDADAYAKYISAKNLWYYGGELNPELEQGIDYAIDDAFEEGGQRKAKDFLPQMSPENRERLSTLIEGIEARTFTSAPFKKHIEAMHDIFMQDTDVSKLQCAMSLIHSETDKVLNMIESEMLYKALKQSNVPARLVITPLLDHADIQFHVKYIKKGFELIGGFEYFFHNL